MGANRQLLTVGGRSGGIHWRLASPLHGFHHEEQAQRSVDRKTLVPVRKPMESRIG